jgi:hypothetical protein
VVTPAVALDRTLPWLGRRRERFEALRRLASAAVLETGHCVGAVEPGGAAVLDDDVPALLRFGLGVGAADESVAGGRRRCCCCCCSGSGRSCDCCLTPAPSSNPSSSTPGSGRNDAGPRGHRSWAAAAGDDRRADGGGDTGGARPLGSVATASQWAFTCTDGCTIARGELV